jgi:hypothetical protein
MYLTIFLLLLFLDFLDRLPTFAEKFIPLIFYSKLFSYIVYIRFVSSFFATGPASFANIFDSAYKLVNL